MDDVPRLNFTIATERPADAVLRWVRFLLGERAGEVVQDPDGRLVVPDSLMVCDRLDLLRSKVLGEVRRAGSVGLLHVGDRRYRSRLGAYAAFGFVWRTYYHSALRDLAVRQLPLGPEAVIDLAPEPTAAAGRAPIERLYTWSFVGPPDQATEAMLDALDRVDGGHAHVSEDGDQPRGVLADSVFAPCPAVGGHLESTRIYDALELGAIPVVERRKRLDYFGELLGDHPLPTVHSWDQAVGLVRRILGDQAALANLHDRVLTWWSTYKRELCEDLTADVDRCLTSDVISSVMDDGPLNRPAPRWRGHIERLRHR